MSKFFYIYIHRRKTDGACFYVGKGTGKRCFSKFNRNKYWHNVVDKHGFTAEILFTSIDEQEVLEKEIEIIALYRSKFKLVNISLGGEGNSRIVEKTITDKQELIRMAEGGFAKPHHNSFLGRRLNSFTNTSSHSYDSDLHQVVSKYWPSRLDKTNSIKENLLKDARAGLPRPKCNRHLVTFTCPSSKTYDEDFAVQIMQFWPYRRDITNNCKQRFLQMAIDGEAKPTCKKDLALLNSYVSIGSHSYDSEFAEQILKLWPQRNNPRAKKKQLLEMASNGQCIPAKNTKEYGWLYNYTNIRSKYYDELFSNKIKQHWMK